jgi:pilus assembly protein CpaB
VKNNKIIAIILAGAGLFGFLALMSLNKGAKNVVAENLNEIVVAKVEVPLGTQLNPEQLAKVQYPKAITPELSFQKPEDLVGRVTINAIGAREPITEFRLAPKGSLPGIGALVPDGYRAATVRVDDEAGVAGLLSPGMLVDVISIVRVANGNRSNTIAKVVLQNIKVLATGQNIATPKEQVTPENVKSVTLIVTPQEAEKLVMSSYDTKLRLIVRSFTDQNSIETPGAKAQTLMAGDAVQDAPPPPAWDDPAAAPSFQPAAAQRAPRRAAWENESYDAPASRKPAAPAPAAAPPAPPVNTVPVYSGSKRAEVAFPQQ